MGAPTNKAAILSTILVSYVMIVLDISVVLTGLPKIQHDLGFFKADLAWVQSAYTLTFGGFLLLGAGGGRHTGPPADVHRRAGSVHTRLTRHWPVVLRVLDADIAGGGAVGRLLRRSPLTASLLKTQVEEYPMTTWLITGCSSGLGRDLAKAVLEAGLNAVVTARDSKTVQDLVASYPDTGMAAALDVTKSEQVQNVVRDAQQRFGGIDVLVNNAGYGYRAAVEEGDEKEVADLFATNVFGTVAMIKAALPGMRARRSGCIINISSIAGRLAAPGSGYYSASKFAVEGLSDALRKEVGPLGIRVMVVEPGAFRTEFAGRSLHQAGHQHRGLCGDRGPTAQGE